MYVPASFAVSDEKILESFIERYDFATLTSSSSSGLVASHIPIMLRRSAGKAVLVGHVARANSHWRQFDGSAEALAIFHGPHAYVSPSWYATSVRPCRRGTIPPFTFMESRAQEKTATSRLPPFETLLRDTRAPGRSHGAWKTWRETFTRSWPRAIVAFEMPIDRIEGKFKLGQNRSQDDRLGMLKGLDAEKSPDADALAEFIRETLKSDGGV